MEHLENAAPGELPGELRSLVSALAKLDDRDRERVIAAARASRGFRTIPWEEFESAKGVAPVGGGDAVVDTEALYDNC